MSLIQSVADPLVPSPSEVGTALSHTSTLDITLEVLEDVQSAAASWMAFEQDAAGTPHQSFAWVKAWHEAVEAPRGDRPLIVLARNREDRMQFLLPLRITRRGPLRILKLLGGDQGNYGSALYAPEFLEDLSRERFLLLWQQVTRRLPRHDIIHFRALTHDQNGPVDPLKWLPTVCSAEYGHAFSLQSDTDALYRACFNSKARAEHRRCERRLGEHGPVAFEATRDPQRMVELFAHLSAQRACQTRETGVPNPLADGRVQEFYRHFLGSSRPEGAPVPQIFALHCGTDIVATNFGISHQGRFYGLLMTTAPGPLKRYGPGTALFRRMVQHLAAEGCSTIDCGAGRDPHKLHWCNLKRERCDALAATSWLGGPVVLAMRLSLAIKRLIKNDDRIWPVVKTVLKRATLRRERLTR